MLGGVFCHQPHAAAVVQEESVPPLYRFFQQHYDSTIVCQQNSAWNQGPDMLILAKQGQQVYLFTYRSPYKLMQGRHVPGGLTQQFSQQEARFRATQPDTNQYLLLQPVTPAKLKQTWKSLHTPRLWQVQDMAARSTNTQCLIEDAETVTLWFLTRRNSRNVSFYAPEFYEKCEGADANRRQVIRTRTELETLLKR
ncbi:hypothetical protein SAMN04487998_3636 [Hymenobacter actinosclerus]|uniref:Uncharacterized protein n=2 Tax=Hymenobacter actinosclerus TaxID=82805 RepID=A0A1I0J3S7_9BACT|nr:hypothetical protein SAMN04487998_3636 [Hymenobacter actinosclerus]